MAKPVRDGRKRMCIRPSLWLHPAHDGRTLPFFYGFDGERLAACPASTTGARWLRERSEPTSGAGWPWSRAGPPLLKLLGARYMFQESAARAKQLVAAVSSAAAPT